MLIFILSTILSVWSETIGERIERIEMERAQYHKRMKALKPETTTYKDTLRALKDDDMELISHTLYEAPGTKCPEGHVRFGASCRKSKN